MFKKLSALAVVLLLSISLVVSVFADEPKEVIKIGITCENSPFSWEQGTGDEGVQEKISGSNNYADGYDIIIAQRIAQKLGRKLEVVKLSDKEFVSALESGKVDIVMSGLANNAENSEKVDFTVPYYYDNFVTLVKEGSEFSTAKSLSDLAGAKVYPINNSIAAQIPDAKFVEYGGEETVPDVIDAIKNGDCDIAVVTRLTAKLANSDLEMLDFYSNNVVALLKKDSAFVNASSLEDFSGAKVYPINEALVEQIPNAQLVKYDEDEEVPKTIDAIKSGDCDIALVKRAYAMGALSSSDDFTMLIIDDINKDYVVSDTEVEICMSVKKGNQELINELAPILRDLSLGGRGDFSFSNYDASMKTAIERSPDFIRAASKEATFFENIVKIISKYGMTYLRGMGMTLLISIVGTFFGCVIGFVVGIIQTIPVDKKRDSIIKRGFLAIIRGMLRAYVEVFRGTPMIVQAAFIYYGALTLFSFDMGKLPAAFFIVSINTGAYMAETVRGGIMSIDVGQTEGAKAIGMTHVQTMLNVILPQTFKVIIPQIGNNFIINIKDTSVLSAISVAELFFSHTVVSTALYSYFESATIVMAIYLTMTLVTSVLLRKLEKKLNGDATYDIATTDTLAYTSGTYNFPKRKKKKEDFR